MIDRIKKIQNIGTYEKSGNGKIKLKPYTYIYAANTYGKTTFCDILRSFKTNDISIINNRRRIGIEDIEKSIVELTINNDNVTYNGTTWNVPTNADIRDLMEIFDINFVNENIFTNFEIEHRNKEGFTSFVLGDRGVDLIQKIQGYESALSQKELDFNEKRDRLNKKLNPINYEIIKKEKYDYLFKDIESILLALFSRQQSLKTQKSQIEEIKVLPKIEKINVDFSTATKTIFDIKKLCEVKCDINLTELKIKLDEIKKETNGLDDQWIKNGIKITNRTCPFCGNDLTQNERVKVFSEYFSEFIVNFIDKIEELQNLLNKNIHSYNISSKLIKISQLWKNISIYCNTNKDFYSSFEENINKLIEHDAKLNNLIESVKEELNKCLTEKMSSLKTTEFCYDKSNHYLVILEEMGKSILDLNEKIDHVNVIFSDYQEKINDKYFDEEILKVQKDYDVNNIKFLRGQYNEEIMELIQLEEHILELKTKIRESKKQIDEQQETFLNKYFSTIQEIFSHLGNENYKIYRETTSRGKKKVYGVKIQFKNKDISETRYCLSESDRRALALSIFLAKIKIDNNPNKILILDDPVTSFDQNRMRSFITTINSLKNKCFCQIILLMHYENFFRLITKITEEKTLIKISRAKDDHIFEEIQESDDIFKNDYEKALSKIIKFINAEINDITENDVRIYFEQYLHNFYAYEISHCPTMITGRIHDFIIELEKQHLIKTTQKDDLILKLKFLNDSSHSFTDYAEEEKRSFIKDAYISLHSIGIINE